MEVIEAINSRRSIRKYKADPVDAKSLNTVLEAARQAPSWANTQCWQFIVVRDSQTREQLAGTLSEGNPGSQAILQAPVTIVACARTGIAGIADGQAETDKGDWYMFDVALAMQNLMLAATSLGLATVCVGRFDAVKAAGILGLTEGYRVVVMTPLGYPDQVRNPRPRKELGEIVYYDRFGRTA